MGMATSLVLSTKVALAADAEPSKLLHVFASFPREGLTQTPYFPTPNDRLGSESTLGFAARIRTNEQYGMPGWTRDMGGRFHKGVDILPIQFEKIDKKVRINYYDPKTKKSFVANEPVLVPKDEIFSILDGVVLVANQEEERSGYGRYIMIQHKFANGSPFLSMYAHLDRVNVKEGTRVNRGDRIGGMGSTSSNAGGRNFLKFVPHCHFEIGRIINANFTKTKFAKLLYPRMVGGNADPRNIQPYDPIQFLTLYKAESKPQLMAAKSDDSRKNAPDVLLSHQGKK